MPDEKCVLFSGKSGQKAPFATAEGGGGDVLKTEGAARPGGDVTKCNPITICYNGVVKIKAAEYLQIPKVRLYRKVKKFGIE